MNIPLNGRVAIIDDQIEQAEPIFKVLSKRQIPFTYFSGEFDYLPNEGDNTNDIRLLFLDINLTGNMESPNRVLKSSLVTVIRRVISCNNFPYVLIYWTRHEHHKALVEDDIFKNDLYDRKPIAFIPAVKSDFFDLDGNKTSEFETNINNLFNIITLELNKHLAYEYLICWENQIHSSTNETLHNVFSNYVDSSWENNASFTLNKLGMAYLGKHFNNVEHDKKIKGSFMSLCSVFKDTIENRIHNLSSINQTELSFSNEAEINGINAINFSLNATYSINNIAEPGNVLAFSEDDNIFKEILHKIISFFKLRSIIQESKPEIIDKILKKECEDSHRRIKDEIKIVWKKICIVVTPTCDFAQNNKFEDRIVRGLLIPKKYKKYIEDKSEAVFLIPFNIDISGIEYCLVIDFRYFQTKNLEVISDKVSKLFRIRQELLSEIQSRLARHINRQGILIID